MGLYGTGQPKGRSNHLLGRAQKVMGLHQLHYFFGFHLKDKRGRSVRVENLSVRVVRIRDYLALTGATGHITDKSFDLFGSLSLRCSWNDDYYVANI